MPIVPTKLPRIPKPSLPSPTPQPKPLPPPGPGPNPLPVPIPNPPPSPVPIPSPNAASCPAPGLARRFKKMDKKDSAPSEPPCPNGGKHTRKAVGSKWVYQFTDFIVVDSIFGTSNPTKPEEKIPKGDKEGVEQFWKWEGRGAKEKDLKPGRRALYRATRTAGLLGEGSQVCLYRYYKRKRQYECRCPDGSKCRT